MSRDIYGEFQAWFEKAKSEGLVDLKFAIDDPTKAKREILEGFLDAELAISAGLVHPDFPEPAGVVHPRVLELLSA